MLRLTSWIAAICLALPAGAGRAQVDAPPDAFPGAGPERGAEAAPAPVVVELFTSQGCISCPPADAVLAELGARDNVIPLALHVDYWDYIGWKDDFADPAYTKRQKGYARAAGRRSIYTPQMVVAGKYDVIGSHPMKVLDAIDHAADMPPRVQLDLRRADDELLIRARPLAPLPAMIVQMVRYHPEKRVRILSGENAGRSIDYSHIAHDWRELGGWSGEAPLELRVPVEGADPVVVMVQEAGYGPIVAAARLR